MERRASQQIRNEWSVVAVLCWHSQCPVQFCVQMTYADRHRLMCVRALACQNGPRFRNVTIDLKVRVNSGRPAYMNGA
jgi:hypothetical protein